MLACVFAGVCLSPSQNLSASLSLKISLCLSVSLARALSLSPALSCSVSYLLEGDAHVQQKTQIYLVNNVFLLRWEQGIAERDAQGLVPTGSPLLCNNIFLVSLYR
jgi:hypothetical protein